MQEIKNESLDLVSGGRKPVQLKNGKWIINNDNFIEYANKEGAEKNLHLPPYACAVAQIANGRWILTSSSDYVEYDTEEEAKEQVAKQILGYLDGFPQYKDWGLK